MGVFVWILYLCLSFLFPFKCSYHVEEFNHYFVSGVDFTVKYLLIVYSRKVDTSKNNYKNNYQKLNVNILLNTHIRKMYSSFFISWSFERPKRQKRCKRPKDKLSFLQLLS